MEALLLAYFLHHFGLERTIRPQEISDTGTIRVEQQLTNVRSFPAGSQRVPLLQLKFIASCDAGADIDSIRVRHRGLGAVGDISGVYFMANGRRLHRSRQVQRNGYADLHMRNVSVPACGILDMTLMADFSSNVSINGEHWFVVERSSDITSDANMSISSARIQPVNTQRPRTVGGRSVGTITVSYPRLLRRVRYGTRQVVSRIRLEADNKSDQLLRAITFTNNGSASDDDLRRLYLETGSSQRVTNIAATMDADRVRLTFDPPQLLRKNQQRLFSLRADVRVGRSRTLQFVIEQPSDIEATSVRGR